MQTDQLDALVAIVDHGTFEAAARRLRLTPSAVSQRIKALENRVGHIVVRRTVPCQATAAGEVLLRVARQAQLLEADAMAALRQGTSGPTDLPLAVNADSLATWFRPVLSTVAGWQDTALLLHIEDEGHSARLLRSGDVLGAVTADPVAVHGCTIEPLGSMRYLPASTPQLRDRFSTGRSVDWSAMPVVRFNGKDDLQHRLLAEHGVDASPPTHQVPSSEGFLAAVHAGLGWGLVPVDQLGEDLQTGRLVRLSARRHVDVPLHWQVWRLRSERIERVSEAVRVAARAGLRPPVHRRPGAGAGAGRTIGTTQDHRGT